MAEIEVEESFETTTVRRKTVRQSIKIEEVSNAGDILEGRALEINSNEKTVHEFRSVVLQSSQRARVVAHYS